MDFNLAALPVTFAFSLDVKSIDPMKFFPFDTDFGNVFMVFYYRICISGEYNKYIL